MEATLPLRADCSHPPEPVVFFELDTPVPFMPDTETQLAPEAVHRRVDEVRERIGRACERAGRSADEITIVGVSKTFPMQAIVSGVAAGLTHFGENRARALRDRVEERPGRWKGGDVCWHMIGHLQTNKAKFVARHADRFEALDSPRLAEELNKRAAKNDRVLPCFVQVNISGADQKYGLPPEELHDFLDACTKHENIHIDGLMGMASFVDDSETVRSEFARLRTLAETYTGDPANVSLEELSMGMSNDFEVAIEEGSTVVRIGSAIFGPRS